jgi:hypothetical protein
MIFFTQGYQSTNQGLYNIDLKQVVDITKPPPNITQITPGILVISDVDLFFIFLSENFFLIFNYNFNSS